MAKRGMKKGSTCLSPSDLKILAQFDKAIYQVTHGEELSPPRFGGALKRSKAKAKKAKKAA